MTIRDLIPWGRGNSQTPAVNPFLDLHREVNRLFDEAFRGFNMPTSFGSLSSFATWPSLEVSETDRDIKITAEVPGLDEKDIEVLLQDGVLALRGEKRAETEDKDRQFSERFYGRFERRIPLGVEIDEDRVNAHFKNGLLTVTLPKSERAQSKAKRIAINGRS
ncbi:Hsp20/alpha crystallin family protein [Chelativorans sp.]|uniref:Hsp20/alpha crystallin family protein n=1 Tax=Chelativorans sp. TaxID=2203393 RepID=UPI0028122F68|nr:Hsp20/alpha crystallin family protein [Chelativorans sp.]